MTTAAQLDLRGFYSDVMAITESGLRSLKAHIDMVTGGRFDPAAAAPSGRSRTDGVIAVIPVMGPLSYRPTFLGSLFGWSNTATITEEIRSAVDNPNIREIALLIDSPGGSVYGVEEAAEAVYQGRARKPITAYAAPLAASAAYWIGSAASRFYAMPSAEVGSIGVIAVHLDHSKALQGEGIQPTVISSGRFKAEGNPYEPLHADARTEMQRRVDEIHDRFVRDVARNRGVTVSRVAEQFGQGRAYQGREAHSRQMIDGTAATLLEALRASTGGRGGRPLQAAAQRLQLLAEADIFIAQTLAKTR